MNRHLIVSALTASLAALVAPATVSADVITHWTFNTNPSDNAPNTGVFSPEIGAGQISLIGGVNQTFAQGSSNDTSPSAVNNNNSSYNTFNYPSFSADNKTAGIQIAVDTSGYQDIVLSFEHRHAPGASRAFRIQYSSDGANYTDGLSYDAVTSSNVFHLRSQDFAAIGALDDNPNVRFRIVAEFMGQGYQSTGGASYMSSGDNRFDLITVSGTPVPEPAGALLLAAPLVMTLFGRSGRRRH